MKYYLSRFPTQKNYKIEKKSPHFSQIFTAFKLHYSPNLPHTCQKLSSLKKVRHRTIYGTNSLPLVRVRVRVRVKVRVRVRVRLGLRLGLG